MTGEIGYGIDFGTSNSTLVIAHADGTFQLVRDPASPLGAVSVPSTVCVLKDGRIAVGHAAQNAKLWRPWAFRAEFKRDFGVRDRARLGDRALRPDELAAEVLRFLRERAAEQAAGEPAQVVITVPAAWEAGKHALMREAAAAAGFDPAVVRLVPEPVAALAQAFGTASGTVLVYDLGGGTFDCALAHGDARGHEVLGAAGGLGDLGGTEFDRIVLRLLAAQAEPAARDELFGADAAGSVELLGRRLRLGDTAEQVKCQLSAVEVHEALVSEFVPPVMAELTRAALEEALRPVLAETLAECDRLLAANGLSWPEVDRIIPVGGSCRVPLVSRMLAEHTGRPVIPVNEPELAIARGAAVLAAAGPPKTRSTRPRPAARPAQPRGGSGKGTAAGQGSRARGRGGGILSPRSSDRASSGPVTKVSITREHAMNGAYGAMVVLVDGQVRARLANRESTTFEIPGGTHEIECRQSGERSNVITVHAAGGELRLVCRFKELPSSSRVAEKIFLGAG
ncbi:Hsp70 family protein [Actinocorallia sp. B10E7]|uniref:Hsp70 family protein n=1 Tax=Actinocorallia sp. B10E7 TaxID=3153558 RepID=UPI00325D6ADD